MLDEETAHAELNSISLVGRNAPFPQRLWDDAEHCAAIQLLAAGLDRVDGEVATLSELQPRAGRSQAVVSRRTGVGNPDALRFLRRLAGARSSVSRSPHVEQPRSPRSESMRSMHFAVASASPPARWRAWVSPTSC